MEAARSLKIRKSSIDENCNGLRRSLKDFRFFNTYKGEKIEPLKVRKVHNEVYIYNENYKLLYHFKNIDLAIQSEKISKFKIKSLIKSKELFNDKYYRNTLLTQRPCVYQYSSNGIFLRKYDNLKDAENQTGLSKSCIGPVCQGHERCYGGFQWFYEDQGEKIPALSMHGEKLKRSINAIDELGNIILSFDSVTGAMKEGYFPCVPLKDPTKKSSGYFWRYSESSTASPQ